MSVLTRFIKIIGVVLLFPIIFLGIMLVPFTTLFSLFYWIVTGKDGSEIALIPIDKAYWIIRKVLMVDV